MSAIYPDHLTAFIHIPKCGGTYIENVLKTKTNQVEPNRHPNTGRHATYCQIMHNRGIKYFSIVREPISWYISYYRFCNGKPIIWEPDVWHPTDCLANADWTTIDSFVESIQDIYPSFLTRMYEQFIGIDGMFPHIKIFRLEDMPNAMNDIMDFMGIKDKNIDHIKEEAKNKSEMPIPTISGDSINLIKEKEKAIYRRFYA